MAQGRTFHCMVVTPEARLFDEPAELVVVPAHDGEMGFEYNHAPLLGKLGVGELRIRTPAGMRRYFISGGFVQVLHNVVTILTDEAVPAEQLDVAEIQRQLTAAEAMPNVGLEQVSARAAAIHRARQLMRIADRRSQ